MRHPKFMIYDGKFRMGMVEFHSELLPSDFERDKVTGGGWFRIEEDKGRVILYGKSMDFGPATRAEIKKAISSQLRPKDIVGLSIHYHPDNDLLKAIHLAEPI